MSGLDPLAAALAAQAAAGAQAAMDEAVLSIGADIAVLQAQINVGDVIAATVLPPQGGTDLLSFLGQTVPAQIPAGVNPGESLLLQVTSFTNTAVIVRNLGVVDPQNPVPTVDVELPPQTPDAPQTAVLTTTVSLPQQSAPPAPPPVPAAQAPPPSAQPPPPASVAPPRSVFVAAAVRAAAPGPVPPEAIERANAVVQSTAASSDVEARIAVLRAGSSLPPQPVAQAPATEPAQSAPLAPPPPSAGRLPVAPPIVLDVSPRAAAASAQAQSQTAPVEPREPETPQAALLARLRVPVTPVTLAAARVMENATSALTSAYEKLDALLARMAPAQIPPSLRSSLGFVARMDLQSSALPEQIAAFVSDVLDGAEAKLAQVIQAWLPVTAEREALILPEPPGLPPALQQQTPAPSAPAPSAPAQALPAAQAQQSAASAEPNAAAVTNATAQASERTIALEYDPKTAILSMLQEQSAASSTASASPAPIVAALRDALVATTAAQLGTLSSQINNPSAIVLSLPAYYYEGAAPVQVRISRDASESKKKMDADNFHIAFVLDTQSLGTVAIDVQTVGRAVSVDVKTQASLAADRFRSSFGDLRSRLERLRYRIANINAGVAAAAGAAQPARAPETANEPPPSRRAFWDTRA